MLSFTGRGLFPPVVKNLLIINGLFFLAQLSFPIITKFLQLYPFQSDNFAPHQLVTYGFVHATHYSNGAIYYGHILMNMFGLWMFGKDIEHLIGPKRFLILYMIGIIVGGVLSELIHPSGLVGASAGVFAVTTAFAMMFPNAKILVYFVLPVKAKYLAILYIGYELFAGFSSMGDGISHFGHIGGVIAAFALIKYWKIPKFY